MRGYGKLLTLVMVLIFGSILACSPTGDGGSKPVVEVLSPSSGSRVPAGEEVEVQFQATDEKAVVRVELEVDGEVVDTQTSPSAEGQPSLTGILRWMPPTLGTYNLMVYAYNSDRAGSAGVGIQLEVIEVFVPVGDTPTPEEVSTTSPAPTGLQFQDDFSNPSSGWEVGQYSEGSVGYRDGYYFVSATAESTWMWGVANGSFGDVEVEVDATQFSAPTNNNNAYGVRCRLQANNDAYHLLISGDGFYSIQKSTGGTFEKLVDWTRSDAINQGNATNQLRVVCDGSRLALYCSGELLGETTDSALTQGDIAFAAVSLESEATEIHFDNLRAYARGAAGQPNATRTPRPTPTPTATLALISLTSTVSPGDGYFVVEGQVRNISGQPLDDVLAVATVMDANRQFITYDDALIEYTTLLPGQVSPFSVMIDYNPAIEYYRVEFTSLWGEPIETRDES